MNTVGKNEKKIAEYTQQQLQDDIMDDQISMKEFVDPSVPEGIIGNPRRSRGFFIYGRSPIVLARVSRHASTIRQPREFCYLPPASGFKYSPSSSVRLLYLRPAGA